MLPMIFLLAIAAKLLKIQEVISLPPVAGTNELVSPARLMSVRTRTQMSRPWGASSARTRAYGHMNYFVGRNTRVCSF